jgi:hypothetical protein
MFGFCGSYVVCSAAASAVLLSEGGTLLDALAVALSVVPIIAAWLGFRIHVSNSITLELATLLSPTAPTSFRTLAQEYGLEAHADRRINILSEGGYLTAAGNLTNTPKTRMILIVIADLCGPDGPSLVAERFRKAAVRRRDGE